jgi:hypothetical protein
LGLWFGVAVMLVVLAYAYPLYDLWSLERFGAVGVRQY